MIYLIRHMQSEANRRNIWGGDYPLTDLGIQQAQKVKKQIDFVPDILVASTLRRARQTAQLLFPKRKIITDATFREINFGNREDTLVLDDKYTRAYDTNPSQLHKLTHGDVMADRAQKAIAKMLEYQEQGKVVAIVCHDTLMRAILCTLKGEHLDNMPKYKPLFINGAILKIDLPCTMEVTNLLGTTKL